MGDAQCASRFGRHRPSAVFARRGAGLKAVPIMCGIAGFWFKSDVPEAAQRWLEDSVSSLRHRGPDDRGLWFDGGVGLGHTRLSILDLSPLGHQPMASQNGRWVMVFNGEVYNFREICKELEMLGR